MLSRNCFTAGVPSEKPDVKQFLDNMTYDRFGVIHLFNWARPWHELLEDQFRVPNLKTGELEPLMSALTEEEGEQFKNMLSRIHTVFQAAKDMDVRVMVDAEQTYFQPAISRITMEMMTKYNKEKAVVFNTYQCYLKEAYNLSFPLGQAGFSVYKYVPYGPVNEVLPYLSRRAHENKGILEKLEKEKSLLRRELRDRVLERRLFHRPEGNYRPV